MLAVFLWFLVYPLIWAIAVTTFYVSLFRRHDHSGDGAIGFAAIAIFPFLPILTPILLVRHYWRKHQRKERFKRLTTKK